MDILNNIKQKKNLSTVACGQCTFDNLKPEHVKLGNRQCPLHQPNCNCWNPSGKQSCPSKVCDAIHDVIVTKHGTFKPYWKNTDTRQWCTEPWGIAKCFINAPGYENKTSATDIDSTGLLHLVVNNKGFHDHIQSDLNIFSKVIEYRNEIFHSSSMELEEKDVNTYLQDMIAVLQDGKELCKRHDAKLAVKKLQELENEDFIITTRNEAEVVHAAIESIKGTIHEFENKLRDKLEKVPTGDDVACLDTRVETLESHIDLVDTRVTHLESRMTSVEEVLKDLKSAQSSLKDNYNYIRKKTEFQEKLIKLYRESLLQVSAIPLQPERNLRNFGEVYVRPEMTCQTKNKNGQKEETKIKSMSDIFTQNGKALKSIYVLGDAGSGKSSFCRSLVNYWCFAHCEGQIVKDAFDGVNEMKKFDFLFYVSLRHCNDVSSIQGMLEKRYKSEILTKILDKESAKTLVVLDGLDEWSPPKPVASNEFQTEGLPERDISMDYAIITTSRPWKIETLGITDREVQKRLKLKGFNRSSVEEAIHKSVPILNESFHKNKHPLDCAKKLANKSLASIIKVPIMLLQLICLWFDDKLKETSKCAIYTGMLELFFSWNDKKKTELELFEKIRIMSEGMQDVELPKYLIDSKIFKINKYLIYAVAHLAYETLFKKTKEASLTFDCSIFEQLEISDEVKTSCLRLGILSEDICPSLCASTCQSTVLSFVHKSVQEYFAAVHIAIMFRARVGSSVDMENAHVSDQWAHFFKTYLSNCLTLDEVLEQENVLVLLCGLEARIATSVSKYIYDIVAEDNRAREYRREIYIYIEKRFSSLMRSIQECILNSVEEVQACQTGSKFYFYLGDVVCSDSNCFSKFSKCPGKQYILPDSVRSFTMTIMPNVSFFENLDNLDYYLDDGDSDDYFGSLDVGDAYRVIEYMRKCRRLETIHIQGNKDACTLTDDLIGNTVTVIDLNVSTLKTLFVNMYDSNCYVSSAVIRCLPNMKHLVALELDCASVTHDDFTSLCTFLSGTSHLEHISIVLDCEFQCREKHDVDLSGHRQLQYFKNSNSVIVTRADTSNLEILEYRSLDHIDLLKVLELLRTAQKLNKLMLYSSSCFYIQELSYNTITEGLILLLPLLHKLRKLHLHAFVLTDNIIKSPSEMKSLKLVLFHFVTMSLTTWQKIVDSLPAIPQSVTVKARKMCITRDGEEFIPYIMIRIPGKEGEEVAALQYVREKEQLFKFNERSIFERDFESGGEIEFSTRK